MEQCVHPRAIIQKYYKALYSLTATEFLRIKCMTISYRKRGTTNMLYVVIVSLIPKRLVLYLFLLISRMYRLRNVI